MKLKFSTLFLTIVLFTTISHTATYAGSIVFKSNNSSIQLKWYSDQLIYPEGINIFRKTKDGNWSKLNSAPIKKDATAANQIKDDSNQDLKFGIEMARDMKPEDFKGVLLLNTMILSFQYNEIAQILGIYFEDTSVPSELVKYKVETSNTSKIIAESDWIDPSVSIESLPPNEITVKEKRKSVSFSWMEEEFRYWGVNVYKSINGAEYKKANVRPILVSESGDKRKPDFFFKDEEVKEKNTYQYYLTTLGFFGKESEKSNVFTINIVDQTPPVAPFQLRKVDVKMNEVEINWVNSIAESDAIGLNVYRSTNSDSGYTKVNSEVLALTDTSYLHVAEKEQGYYYYKVGAIDEAGNVGFSSPIFIEVYDLFPPSKPMNFEVTADTGKAHFTWTANSEGDLKGYRIYRTVKKDPVKQDLMLVNGELIDTIAYTDILRKRAKNEFKYFLYALDSNFNMSEGNGPIVVRLPDVDPPSDPFIKQVKQIEEYASVQFIPNVDDDLSHYEVYRKVENGKSWKKINAQPVPRTSSKYRDRTITPGTKYAYYLTAVDSSGNTSKNSNIIVFKSKNADITTNLDWDIDYNLKKKKSKVKIRWENNLETEFILGYSLYRKEDNRFIAVQPLFQDKKLTVDLNTDNPVHRFQLRLHHKSGDVFRKDIQINQ